MTEQVKQINSEKKSITIPVKSVASIDPSKCVNCGECRDKCPVKAISQNQRTICRVCPECADNPAQTIDEMYDFTTKEACTVACPLGISPQGYINLVRAEKQEKALEIIWKKNPLTEVCGRICDHPCEQACKRGTLVDTPIAIRSIKRYLSDTVDFHFEKYPRVYDETVAVIGAGPAGLTAAHYLSQEGYEVTVYDLEQNAGGMLRKAIPAFRLPREVLDKDLIRLEEAGMHFELGQKISKVQFEELKKEYDAIVVATGAVWGKELHIDGWRKNGITNAMSFMEQINNNISIRRHSGQLFKAENVDVVVIGGGAVAIDTARAAVRIGAKSVTAICMECGTDIPAHQWEIDDARTEGIVIKDGWSPVKYLGDAMELKGIEICKSKSYHDENGRIQFKIDEDVIETLPADLVITAIGQPADQTFDEFKDDDKVFFAGFVGGSEYTVVQSMASGKAVAREVDIKLQERDLNFGEIDNTLTCAPKSQKIYPATRPKAKRNEMPQTDPAVRVRNFEEVDIGFNKTDIDIEVLSCLQCGYAEVNTDQCIGCGVCKMVCPKGDVITMVNAEVTPIHDVVRKGGLN